MMIDGVGDSSILIKLLARETAPSLDSALPNKSAPSNKFIAPLAKIVPLKVAFSAMLTSPFTCQ